MTKHYFGEQGFCVFCGASQEDALSLPCEPIDTPPDGFAYPMPEEAWSERISDGELDTERDDSAAASASSASADDSHDSHGAGATNAGARIAPAGGDGANLYRERRRFDSRLESRVLDLIHSGLAIRPH